MQQESKKSINQIKELIDKDAIDNNEDLANFNAGESDAIVYTRDKAVMRKLDTLVTEFPKVYRCIGETDIDKTYSMPKSFVNYRRPRNVSLEKRAQARELMNSINQRRTS